MATDSRERETIQALFHKQQYEERQKLRQTPLVQNLTQSVFSSGPSIVTGPGTMREKIRTSVNVGQRQVQGDYNRFLATANILAGRDKKAKEQLAYAQLRDEQVAEMSAGLTPFEEFLDAPTFEGFVEQAVTLTAKFIPNMGLSIAAAVGTGGAAVAGKFAVNQGSKQFAKQMTKEIAQKKMAGEALDEAEEIILDTSYNYMKTFKVGAFTGAFGQEQIVGVGQAASEYQDAGIELTKEEALMSQLLGIPQAILGVVGEAYIASSLIKSALARSPLRIAQKKAMDGKPLSPREKNLIGVWGKYKGGAKLKESEKKFLIGAGFEKPGIGRFVRDVAVGFAGGAVAEGITESLQEEVTIQQRFAIDPEYTSTEANLRRAEAAFGGFFAGGAMKGVGDAAGSLISQARELSEMRTIRNIENLSDNPLNSTLPENQGTLDSTAADMMDPETGRKSMWVDANTTVETNIEKELRDKNVKVVTFKDVERWNATLQKQLKGLQAKVEDTKNKRALFLEMEEATAESMRKEGIPESEISAYIDSIEFEEGTLKTAEKAEQDLDNFLTRLVAFDETSKLFQEFSFVPKQDFAEIQALNTELIALSKKIQKEELFSEESKKQLETAAELQNEIDKRINDIREGLTSPLGPDQQRQPDFFPGELQQQLEYSNRLTPKFDPAWVAKQENFLVVPTEAGTLYTIDPEHAELIAEMGPTPGVLATILGMNKVSNPEHDLVIEVTDEKGVPIKQETTNEEEFEDALNGIKDFYPGITEMDSAVKSKYKWQKRALPSVIKERGFFGTDEEGDYLSVDERQELEEQGFTFEDEEGGFGIDSITQQEEQMFQAEEDVSGAAEVFGEAFDQYEFTDPRTGQPLTPEELSQETIILNKNGTPWQQQKNWFNKRVQRGVNEEGKPEITGSIERIQLEEEFLGLLDPMKKEEMLEQTNYVLVGQDQGSYTAVSEFSDGVLKAFIKQKRLNPTVEYSIDRVPLEDGTVGFQIAKLGQGVAIENVMFIALQNAINRADAQIAEKSKREFLWTATYVDQTKDKKSRTVPRPIDMNALLAAALTKQIDYLSKAQRQRISKLSENLRNGVNYDASLKELAEIQPITYQATQEIPGLGKSLTSLTKKALEGLSYRQQLSAEFADVLITLVHPNLEIQLYYNGVPIQTNFDATEGDGVTWEQAADFPIWYQNRREYSLNQMAFKTVEPAETIQSQISLMVNSILYGLPLDQTGMGTYIPTAAQQVAGRTRTTTEQVTSPDLKLRRRVPTIGAAGSTEAVRAFNIPGETKTVTTTETVREAGQYILPGGWLTSSEDRVVDIPQEIKKYPGFAERNIAELLENASNLEEAFKNNEITLREALQELNLITSDTLAVPETIDIQVGRAGGGRWGNLSSERLPSFTIDISDFIDTNSERVTFKSVDHAYQTLKSGTFHEPTHKKYKADPEGSTKKHKGKAPDTKNDWNLGLMKDLLEANFKQNPAWLAILKDTKTATLTHTRGELLLSDPNKGYGKMLMEIRAELPLPTTVVEKATQQLEKNSLFSYKTNFDVASAPSNMTLELANEVLNRLYGFQNFKTSDVTEVSNTSPRAQEKYVKLLNTMANSADAVRTIKRKVPKALRTEGSTVERVEADTLSEFLSKISTLPALQPTIEKDGTERSRVLNSFQNQLFYKTVYAAIKSQYDAPNGKFKAALNDTRPFQIQDLHTKLMDYSGIFLIETLPEGHKPAVALFGETEVNKDGVGQVRSLNGRDPNEDARDQAMVAIYKALQTVRDEEAVADILEDIQFEMGLLTRTQKEQTGLGFERDFTPDYKKYTTEGPLNEIDQIIKSSSDNTPYGVMTEAKDRQGRNVKDIGIVLTPQEEQEGLGFVDSLKGLPSDVDIRKRNRRTVGQFSKKAALNWSRAADLYFKKNYGPTNISGKLRGRSKYEGTPILETFSKIVNDKLKLKSKIEIIMIDEVISNLNIPGTFVVEQKDASGKPVLTSANPIKYLQTVRQDMKDTGDPGRIVTFGDTNIIIIDPEAGAFANLSRDAKRLAVLFTLAHEIGHPFLEEEKAYFAFQALKGNNLWDRFEKDFEAAKAKIKDQPDHTYNQQNGIDEWYSDQFALSILKLMNDVEQAEFRRMHDFSNLTEAQIDEEVNKGNLNAVDSYFTRLAKKFYAFFKELSAELQSRFRKRTDSFAEYMENMVQSNRRALETGIGKKKGINQTITQAKFIREAGAKMKNFFPPKYARQLDTMVTKMMKEGEQAKRNLLGQERAHWGWKYLLKTADGYIRPISPAIANVFYNASQSQAQRGHLNARIWLINRKMNKVWDLMDPEKPGNPTAEEVEAFVEVLKEAEQSEITIENLSPKAAKVRQFLSEYNESIKALGLSPRKNFFPRQFNIESIVNDETGFQRQMLISILEKFNPDATVTIKRGKKTKKVPVNFELVVDGMLKNVERSDDNPHNAGAGAQDLAIGMAEERHVLFRNVPNEYFRRGIDASGNLLPADNDAELLMSPEIALRKYVEDMEKRLDYEKRAVATLTEEEALRYGNWGDEGDQVKGWRAMEVLINRIEDPVERQGVRRAVSNMLGKVGMNMKNWEREANSWMLTLNIMSYLTMATVASLPDLAGSILRSKDFSALGTFVDQWKIYLADRDKAQAFARDVGVITFDSINTMYINAAELGFMTPLSKKVSNFYFKSIGLETFTKFTRVFAAGMGEQFLLRTAQDKSDQATRWLKELHVTREDILYWNDPKKGNRRFDSEQGKRVQNAIAQFVDESVIRPNAAERPVWASNPYFALVWQLKSFFYAYGKNILGGAMREMNNRYKEGGLSQAAIPLLIGAVPMLVLSMLGLEIREFIKYLAGGGDASKFRTDEMGAIEYFFEIVDRAGLFGAFTLLFPMFTAGKYGDEFWISPLGPTAQRVEDLFKGEVDFVDDWLPWVAAIN
tara:strand:+ start:465 stop:9203 length:8739 start_codon:yes stop_codon:yes gene_type:complete